MHTTFVRIAALFGLLCIAVRGATQNEMIDVYPYILQPISHVQAFVTHLLVRKRTMQ